MKRYIIDANALISLVTDRSPDQQKKITPFFESAAELKAEILCHQYVLTEFVYVLDKVYKVEKKEITKMLMDLLKMPGIRLVQEIDFDQVFKFWPFPIKDFGDAVIASIGKNIKGSIIVTFDKKFCEILKSIGISIIPL